MCSALVKVTLAGVLSICATPRAAQVDVFPSEIKGLERLADWRRQPLPLVTYGGPDYACGIQDTTRYGMEIFQYQSSVADNKAANREISKLDAEVVRYLKKEGWRKRPTKSNGGIPDLSRCYERKGVIVGVGKATGRCTMNTPCRVYDGYSIVVYRPRTNGPV